MTPRRKLPAEPDQLSSRHHSNPGPPEATYPISKGKNTRKRSSDSDEEAGAASPSKKRATNRSPPLTAGSSTVSTRVVSRRSTRKASTSATKEVKEPIDPDSDAIVIDDDGHPYVAYDDAPHLHPPPRRYKQKKSEQPAALQEKVKGCSIQPCWTPTQQRRCRTLQTDEAVEEIGWKNVRKWMQAVRCGLCGETQVLRDLTKGCFNLEHWWRHLRVRHGIKRGEEIEEKGEEKYEMLPIKDHVCVGACATCGEGGEAVSRRQQNPSPSPRQARNSDLSSLSSIDTNPSPPRKFSPEIIASTLRVEPPSPDLTPMIAGPSNINHPRAHSALCTLAGARPRDRYEYATLTTFPTSSCRDLPPLVPPSWAPYISDPSSHLSPLSPLPAPDNQPSVGTRGLNASMSEQERTSTPSAAHNMSSPRLPPVKLSPPGPHTKRDTADESPFMYRRSPTATVSLSPNGASATLSMHTRSKLLSRSTSAFLPTQSPAIASSSFIQPGASMASSGSPLSLSITAEAIAVVPSLSNYLWPPANNRPVGAPSPPCMTAASWEDPEGDIEDEIEVPPTLRPLKNVRGEDTNEMEVSARLLHHFSVSAWKESEMVDGS
ncbi:hypothetical protein GSI_12577 [Ganoderma sinense ZZ0214-1]|uniref:Uncharacterized protein n=1 Tax=Ganoderma sinense ZZ0214-1 TaxID=1077348 RepID=A0A2G8RT71_9APHY|nr:hypothetical protein GSI_12577 [Ganoderma sinense ZZ0214-1]